MKLFLNCQDKYIKLIEISILKKSTPWSYVKINPKTSSPILDEEGNIQWDGYCIDFVKRLSEKLDFDYVLVPPTRGLLGDRVPGMNNTWDGLVGDLVTGVVLFFILVPKHF